MEYWIWLSQLKGVGVVMQKRLLDYFQTPYHIYEAEEEELLSIPRIGPKLARKIRESRSLDRAFAILEDAEQKGIKILTQKDPLYPDIAKNIDDAPSVLYYKGHLRGNSIGVGIIGSRRCTSYGKEVAIEAAKYLVKQKIPVISGLAKGIDGYAHTACLKSGGYPLAFLGNGVDIVYPKEHRELLQAVVSQGAIISEYPPNTKVRAEYFPQRNRLISSWSQKLLVVEAAEKSGALITAQLARIQEREVLVPPHDIYSVTGKGTNQLLRKGATIYLTPNQLLLDREYIGVERLEDKDLAKKGASDNIKNISKSNLTEEEEKIRSALIESIKTIEEIGHVTGIDPVKLIEHLSIMELEGTVVASAGGRFKLGH